MNRSIHRIRTSSLARRAAPALALLGLLAVASVQAATFTVTNAGNSGPGTLRQAIFDANVTPAADTIAFAIPGSVVHTITPLIALPTIVQPLTIDGYTQPGAVPNTLAEGSNAVIRVRLDGAAAGAAASGLSVCANETTIRGLAITGFAGSAIAHGFDANINDSCLIQVNDGVVTGNVLGLAANGVTAAGNGDAGVFVVNSPGLVIGGSAPAERNVIGANAIGVSFGGGINPTIVGNLIGTDRSGRLDRGNAVAGVRFAFGGGNATLGSAAAPNLIAFNGVGVRVIGVTGARLHANRYRANDTLAIDLSPDGVTANDVDDVDTGANGLQNFPVIANAIRSATGVTLRGDLDRPGVAGPLTYRIAAYASTSCDASGFGEGERYLGAQDVVLPDPSSQTFEVTLDVDGSLPLGTQVTTTATDAAGNTSEMSACVPVEEDFVSWTVTKVADTNDGTCDLDCSLREALVAANLDPGPSVVDFAIPGPGPHTLVPTSALPSITTPILIDGYTQPGAAPNTLVDANNAVIRIGVDGSLAGNVSGFGICGSDTTLRGLAVTRFPQSQVRIGSGATGATCGTSVDRVIIAGNFLGLEADGTTAGGSTVGGGVFLVNLPPATVADARIGGTAPADSNVISANLGGVQGVNTAVVGARIDGNLIGTDASGALDRGNSGGGVESFFGAKLDVGSQRENRIAFNGLGVLVQNNSTGVTLFGNDMFANDALGIDLTPGNAGDGVTPNDADDGDTGGNGLQNFPTVGRAASNGVVLELQGTLDVPAATVNAIYTIGVYESGACDGSGSGEGAVFLGAFNVPMSGSAQSFESSLGSATPIGAIVTLTATAPDGSTSEFSPCRVVTDANVLLRDGFENP